MSDNYLLYVMCESSGKPKKHNLYNGTAPYFPNDYKLLFPFQKKVFIEGEKFWRPLSTLDHQQQKWSFAQSEQTFSPIYGRVQYEQPDAFHFSGKGYYHPTRLGGHSEGELNCHQTDPVDTDCLSLLIVEYSPKTLS